MSEFLGNLKKQDDCPLEGCADHPRPRNDAWTPWQEVLHRDTSGQAYGEWLETEPVVRAESLGHTVAHDPPANVLSQARRWTCVECGACVIRNNAVIYGSAVESPCEPSPPDDDEGEGE